jgi:AcrR family transcriptional regulator
MKTTERKKEILKAAFVIIARQGMSELTIKNLARAVGVSEPALYRHFDSKASILSAIVDEMIALRDEAWRNSLPESSPASECLKSFFLSQARSFELLPSLAIVLYPDMLFRQDPDLLERIRSMIKETVGGIRKILDKGVAEGSFRKDMDADAVSLMLIGGFRILVSEWQMNGDKSESPSLSETTRQYLQSILRLISAARSMYER